MRTLIRRLRHWRHRRREEEALREELAFHQEMRRRELEQDGLEPADAARAARRAMGNIAMAREDARHVWLWRPVEQCLQDGRYAARALTSRPGFTATAVALLALGIGITTAMFTILDALILRPVPFAAPEQLASVAMMSERGGRVDVHPAVLRAWRETPVFTAAEGAMTDTVILEIGGVPLTRGIVHVTPGLFEMLGGVRPVRGRLFDRSEGRAGSDDRVLLSEAFWRSHLSADEHIIGRRVSVDGESATVVGILPEAFRFPSWNVAIWRPIDFDAPPPARRGARPVAYVRFAPETPREDSLRIATAAAQAADASTGELEARALPIVGLRFDQYGQRAVPILTGGVVLVFLVLCANLASLLLARLTARRREFSMQSALGASRGRLMQQAALECVMMGVLGVGAGVAVSYWLIVVAHAFLPDAILLQTLNPMRIDARALAVASACGVVATVGAGLLPAWLGTRVDAGQSLRVVDRGGTETRGARVLTRGLLVGEVALACTLLVGATLLVRSFVNLAGADRGLDPTGLVVARMLLSGPQLSGRTAREAAAARVEEQVRLLPGVRQVAWSYGAPGQGGSFSFGLWHSDAPGAPAVDMRVNFYEVGPDFFALYGVPLLSGRTFQPGDPAEAVIVGERLARALWPDMDPIGRTFRFGAERFHVIGLARELHHPSVDPLQDNPEFYHRFDAIGAYPTLTIRCGAACPATAVIHQRIASAHPALSAVSVRPLEEHYTEALARPRAAAALGTAFAVIAMLAAAGGLFSVLSYGVASRRREFGIRSALGASPARLRAVVLREGAGVALAGVAIGSVGGWVAARALTSLHYGVTAHDPVSWTAVLALLTLTVLTASWRPAREAMHVDPVRLLRED